MLVKVTTGDPKAREKPCLRCGYSLRKNLDAKHCPECGLSVWLSLNGDDSLERSKPDWVAGISAAALILAAAQLLGFITFATTIFGGLTGAAWTHLLGWPAAVYAMGIAVGCYLLGQNEHRYPDRWASFRFGCKALAAVAVLVALICLVIATSHYGKPAIPVGPRAPSMFIRFYFISHVTHHVDTAIEWLSLFVTLMVCGYSRSLALRLPRSRFSRLCGWLMLLPLLAFVKSLPIVYYFVASFLGSALYFLPLIYLPATAILWTWFAIRVRRAAAQARREWATETAEGAMVTA